MGVIIKSKNKTVDIGYLGFRILRTKVSELVNDDIFNHYKELAEASYIFNEDKKMEFLEKYDKETERLDNKYDYKYNSILHFLHVSDCEAIINVKTCKDIYGFIKDYDDDIYYGYIGRKNCAMFKDFKELVKDCIDNNCPMKWF